MSLSSVYGTASMEISEAVEEPKLDGGFNQNISSHFSSVYGSCCIAFVWCLVLNSKSSPLSSLSLCLISTAWLKSSNNQSVFLWSVLPTIPSIRLFFELWFSLKMRVSFPNGCWETHQLGEQGHYHKKIWPRGTHFMVSLGGSVCTTCFIVVFVCGLFTVQVGNLCSRVLLFLCLY